MGIGNDRLKGCVAIVTGGGQGVGQGIAFAMAKAGAQVVVTGRTVDKVEQTVESIRKNGGQALAVAGDVADAEVARRTVAETVTAFGKLDILVNNAHAVKIGIPLEDTSIDVMRQNIESGLYGTFHFMQAAFPHMKEKGGSIINLGSYNGIASPPGSCAYAATKEGIRALSRVAAREWGRFRIRVNVINPAALSPAAEKFLAENPEHEKEVMQRIALGYLGDPEEDIGHVAVFLASNAARYVTGQTINVDGGQLML